MRAGTGHAGTADLGDCLPFFIITGFYRQQQMHQPESSGVIRTNDMDGVTTLFSQGIFFHR